MPNRYDGAEPPLRKRNGPTEKLQPGLQDQDAVRVSGCKESREQSLGCIVGSAGTTARNHAPHCRRTIRGLSSTPPTFDAVGLSRPLYVGADAEAFHSRRRSKNASAGHRLLSPMLAGAIVYRLRRRA